MLVRLRVIVYIVLVAASLYFLTSNGARDAEMARVPLHNLRVADVNCAGVQSKLAQGYDVMLPAAERLSFLIRAAALLKTCADAVETSKRESYVEARARTLVYATEIAAKSGEPTHSAFKPVIVDAERAVAGLADSALGASLAGHLRADRAFY